MSFFPLSFPFFSFRFFILILFKFTHFVSYLIPQFLCHICCFFTLFSSFSGMLPQSPEHRMIVQAISCLAAFILFQNAGASSISKPLSSISKTIFNTSKSIFCDSKPLSTSCYPLPAFVSRFLASVSLFLESVSHFLKSLETVRSFFKGAQA